jgi:nuclear pore complex protein Nup188
VLYSTTTRSASISEGLIRGAVMSSFGTFQANREIWEKDVECNIIVTQIRDQLVVIAVEALGLAHIITNTESEALPGTILQSRDRIYSVHRFILEQSEELDPRGRVSQAEMSSFPTQPMAIVCLAWSIALQYLPPALLPPDMGDLDEADESPVYQRIALRALRLQSGLFPWLEELLSGPLLEPSREVMAARAAGGVSIYRREVLKGEHDKAGW